MPKNLQVWEKMSKSLKVQIYFTVFNCTASTMEAIGGNPDSQ